MKKTLGYQCDDLSVAKAFGRRLANWGVSYYLSFKPYPCVVVVLDSIDTEVVDQMCIDAHESQGWEGYWR
jgi:hypothetical protein